MRRLASPLRPALALLLCLSLCSAFFAHRAHGEVFDVKLQAFLHAGGAIEDICSPSDHAHHVWAETCLLCLSGTAVTLPENAALPRPWAGTTILVLGCTDAAVDAGQARDGTSPPVRGPPLRSI